MLNNKFNGVKIKSTACPVENQANDTDPQADSVQIRAISA
jgi:hypothetical protein